jgi:hypothetical protein
VIACDHPSLVLKDFAEEKKVLKFKDADGGDTDDDDDDDDLGPLVTVRGQHRCRLCGMKYDIFSLYNVALIAAW